MKFIMTLLVLCSGIAFMQAQNNNSELPLSINDDGSQPHNSAMLDVQSTSKGMLVPRMTSVQRTSILNPAQGLLVFDTGTGSFWFYNGGWIDLRSDANQLRDADNDTKVQVEKNLNDNTIRFDLEGTEKMVLYKNPNEDACLDLPNNNGQVFIGPGAGFNNLNTSDGDANTFLGNNAGQDNTTGNSNTFIGGQAGQNATTGSANTFVGEDAGLVSNGKQNTYIGVNAGRNITTGDYNTYIGLGSGNNAPGNYNTFLGYAAGQSASGNSNVFIGTATGSHNTGTGNIFLGNSAGFNETGSNLLYIENSLSVSPLIYGDFSTDQLVFNGNVGIGTMPVSQLDVEGGLSVGAGYAGSSAAPVNGAIFEGYVGVGTNSPGTGLHVKSAAAYGSALSLENTGGGQEWRISSWTDGTLRFVKSFGLFTISPLIIEPVDGYVGIGTSIPDQQLSVHNSSGISYIRVSDSTTGPSSGLRMGLSGSGNAYIINDEPLKNLSLGTDGTSQMRINDIGQVGINNLSPDMMLHIKQDIVNRALRLEHHSATDYWDSGVGTTTKNYKFYYNNLFRADISSVDGSYTQSSDRRLKQDIKPMDAVLGKVNQLKPSTYQYIDSPAGFDRSIGFIAQDVENVFPDLVREGDEGNLGLVYDGFAVIAIKAIQEQQQLIEELQARIEQLEAQQK